MFSFLAPYRLYAIIAAAIIAVGAISYAWHHHNATQQAIGAQRVTEAYQQGYDKATKEVAAKELADRILWEKQASDYEAKLHALRHPANPTPAPVVLCHQSRPHSSTVPTAATITSRLVTADPAGLAQPHEADIGQDLIAFATDVQAMAIQCKAIQEGYLKLSGQTF